MRAAVGGTGGWQAKYVARYERLYCANASKKKQTEDADGDEAGDWDRAAESERRLKLSLLSLLLWVLRDGLQF